MAQTENSVTAYDVEDWKNKGRTKAERRCHRQSVKAG